MKRDFLPAPPPAKEDIRRTLRARLRAMDPLLHAEASLVICQTAANLPAFSAARCVALFAPLPSEPDVRLLVEEAWAQGKQVALPLMLKQKEGPQLEWHQVGAWEELILAGPFGLREPDPLGCPRVAMGEIDCAFIPGLAFDATGLRLGRGGGFYDYFLNRAPAGMPRLGVMFSGQQVAQVPREPHDQALPAVITEDGIKVFPSAAG